MTADQLIAALHPELTALRRELHAHPELAFEERRTSDVVAAWLEKLGLEVHRGLGGTGVVARLKAGDGSGSIGLRADMDALPLTEQNAFEHRSTHEGRMHACGHDGHMTLLLGAARVLTETRGFNGTVHFIFQPAEEGGGGGRVMVEQGLFRQFPMDAVFALHNWPGLDVGHIAMRPGPMMAAADQFEIRVRGRGAHAARPHESADVIVASAALVQALQSLVSRNVDPMESAVVSVTRISAGTNDNVLPAEAVLGGTVRTFSKDICTMLQSRIGQVCHGIEAAFGVSIDLDYKKGYPPTINAEGPVALAREVAHGVFGEAHVHGDLAPSMGAEDFSYLAQEVPACYAWLGNGPVAGGCLLHSPHFDFNDQAIPLGVRYWVRLVETALPAAAKS
jgi:hippurate hydrolase